MKKPTAHGDDWSDDWLYFRLYPGHDADTDEALRVVAGWLPHIRPCPDRWHFLRYFDTMGHHLRVRLCGSADDVDMWSHGISALDDEIHAVDTSERSHILSDPLLQTHGYGFGTSLSVYSPEIAKYGTGPNLRAAEKHFDAASTWCLDQQVWRWSPEQRAAFAVDYLLQIASCMGSKFLEAHNRQWLPRLRLAAVGRDNLERASELVQVTRLVNADRFGAALNQLVVSHWFTGARKIPNVMRSVHLLHMDLNRLGVNPVEECLAGLVASAILERKGT